MKVPVMKNYRLYFIVITYLEYFLKNWNDRPETIFDKEWHRKRMERQNGNIDKKTKHENSCLEEWRKAAIKHKAGLMFDLINQLLINQQQSNYKWTITNTTHSRKSNSNNKKINNKHITTTLTNTITTTITNNKKLTN